MPAVKTQIGMCQIALNFTPKATTGFLDILHYDFHQDQEIDNCLVKFQLLSAKRMLRIFCEHFS